MKYSLVDCYPEGGEQFRGVVIVDCEHDGHFHSRKLHGYGV